MQLQFPECNLSADAGIYNLYCKKRQYICHQATNYIILASRYSDSVLFINKKKEVKKFKNIKKIETNSKKVSKIIKIFDKLKKIKTI